MRNFILTIFSVAVVFFQLSIAGTLFSQQRIPDLTLAMVVTLAVAMGFENSIKWAILAGLLLDMGTNTILGTTALVFLVISWAVSRLSSVADIRSKRAFFLFSLAFMSALSEIIKDLAMVESAKIKVYYSQNSAFSYLFHYNYDYFLKIIFTVMATFVIYYAFRKITRFLFLQPVKLARNV